MDLVRTPNIQLKPLPSVVRTKQLATIGVVGGLVVVVLELRQARELAFIQISHDAYIQSQQLDAMIVGEDLATTMAKVNSPDAKLTADDFYKYDGYVFSRITLMRSSVRLAKLGFYESDWESYVDKMSACFFFGNDIGQVYLSNPALYEDEVVARLKKLSIECEEEDNYLMYMMNNLPAKRISR
jgi:hypothetical protein